jgi:hypothetical protein
MGYGEDLHVFVAGARSLRVVLDVTGSETPIGVRAILKIAVLEVIGNLRSLRSSSRSLSSRSFAGSRRSNSSEARGGSSGLGIGDSSHECSRGLNCRGFSGSRGVSAKSLNARGRCSRRQTSRSRSIGTALRTSANREQRSAEDSGDRNPTHPEC